MGINKFKPNARKYSRVANNLKFEFCKSTCVHLTRFRLVEKQSATVRTHTCALSWTSPFKEMYGDEAGEFVCIYTEATVFTHYVFLARWACKRGKKRSSLTLNGVRYQFSHSWRDVVFFSCCTVQQLFLLSCPFPVQKNVVLVCLQCIKFRKVYFLFLPLSTVNLS